MKKREFSCTVGGNRIDTATKTVWRFPKKLQIKPSYDPAIPLLAIYPEKTKTEKGTCNQRSPKGHPISRAFGGPGSLQPWWK